MLIFFPSGTDAPCYHPPFATFGLIAFNIVVFALQCALPGLSSSLELHHGSFNPITWLTSVFMHRDLGHLLGNMMVFVVFGWIIEGKIGWWRTIVLFMGIGVVQNILELAILSLLGFAGSSLGASSAIFGFIAIALLWAPENNISITYAGILFFWPFYGTVEIGVAVFCFFMIAVEFLSVWFWGLAAGSAILHLLGVIPGLFIGYLMIKRRMVDCDGYDLVSIWQGREGEKVPTVAAEKEQQEREKQHRRKVQNEIRAGLQKVNDYMRDEQHEMALKRFQMLRNKDRTLVMTERQLLTIIKAFDQVESTRERILPLIQDYLKHYRTHRESLILLQAKVLLLNQERPRKTLRVLRALEGHPLSPKQRRLLDQLVNRAKIMIANGVLEFE